MDTTSVSLFLKKENILWNIKELLLKLSGEALAGDDHFGINANTVADIARQIKEAKDLGVEIAIVCGGGNIGVVLLVHKWVWNVLLLIIWEC